MNTGQRVRRLCKNKVKILRPAGFVATLASLVFVLAFPASGSDTAASVDPIVLQDTANGQTAQFLVVLRTQVNTRAIVSSVPNRLARAQLVLSSLRQAADATQAPVRAVLNSLGVRYRAYWIVNLFAVEGDQRVVAAMASRSDVASIESNRAFRVPLEQPVSVSPLSPQTLQWNIQRVNAPGVWADGYTGIGRTYANADTGVEWDHPALKPHYRGWNGTAVDHNYHWWDAIHYSLGGNPAFACPFNSPSPCDDSGHGTHTMGIGVGDDGFGNQIGVAPGAKWIACRNMQGGVGQPSTYIECFQFFLAPTDMSGNNPDPSRAPDSVGNSYGCPPSEGCTAVDVLQQAMNNLRASGVFMAVSAGNNGYGCSTVTDPPAIYDAAITVGATQMNNIAALFSSRGPVAVDHSGRIKPDLVAPGVAVLSSYPHNTYAEMNGTSMAAPHVAGAVALLWSAFPILRRNVDLTESILMATARPSLVGTCGGAPYLIPNNIYGAGLVDVLAACNYLDRAICPNYTSYRQYLPLILQR